MSQLPRSDHDRLRRRVVLAVLAALHVVVIVGLLRPAPRVVPAVPAPAMALREIAVPAPPAAAPPAPSISVDIAPPVVDLPVDVAGPAPCAVVAALTTALGRDPAVVAALEPLSLATRAVMVWDGHWTRDADPALRGRIVATIAAADTRCVKVTLQGPQLLFVTTGAGVVTIAIGSGHWRWNDLSSKDGQKLDTPLS